VQQNVFDVSLNKSVYVRKAKRCVFQKVADTEDICVYVFNLVISWCMFKVSECQKQS